MRIDSRIHDELRKIKIITDYQVHPLASILIECGNTRVICAVTETDEVPPFIVTEGHGWLTAEYSLLPSATHERSKRESVYGKVSGRTMEIQRLIGRALRSVTKLELLGERTLILDCDVVQADGGTRTAAITGGFVALVIALNRLREGGSLNAEQIPVRSYLAATSVGITEDSNLLLDLSYDEDRSVVADLNIVRTGDGRYVEIQGGAEKMPFSYDQLQNLLKLANSGIDKLIEEQKKVIGNYLEGLS